MKFLTYFIKLRFGSFFANCSMSELNPNPMMVEFGLLKTFVRVSSRTLLFYKDTRSIKNAFFAPLI